MSGPASRSHDPIADRAAALIRDLDSHKSDEPRIADPMDRLVARIIDVCVWFAIALFVWVIANAIDLRYFPGDEPIRAPDGQTIYARRTEPAVSWGGLVAIGVLACLYETVPTAMRGSHFAKRRMKLRVVGPDGLRPSFRRSALRWIVCWVPISASFMAAVGALTTDWAFLFIALQFVALTIPGAMFFDDAHLGIHDRIAGTRVLADR